ncbi:uncharacterized protein LOC144882592 isoform X2 [Branchiostoma floridae x Branchiostoma japonicum]
MSQRCVRSPDGNTKLSPTPEALEAELNRTTKRQRKMATSDLLQECLSLVTGALKEGEDNPVLRKLHNLLHVVVSQMLNRPDESFDDDNGSGTMLLFSDDEEVCSDDGGADPLPLGNEPVDMGDVGGGDVEWDNPGRNAASEPRNLRLRVQVVEPKEKVQKGPWKMLDPHEEQQNTNVKLLPFKKVLPGLSGHQEAETEGCLSTQLEPLPDLISKTVWGDKRLPTNPTKRPTFAALEHMYWDAMRKRELQKQLKREPVPEYLEEEDDEQEGFPVLDHHDDDDDAGDFSGEVMEAVGMEMAPPMPTGLEEEPPKESMVHTYEDRVRQYVESVSETNNQQRDETILAEETVIEESREDIEEEEGNHALEESELEETSAPAIGMQTCAENASTTASTHEGKRYTCEVCGYETNRRNTMATHMRTHTGEKPYKCDQCDYAAVWQSNLTRRTRTHTKEKPYKCDQCEFATAYSWKLRDHVAKHAAEIRA